MFTGIIRAIGNIAEIQDEPDGAVLLNITTPSADLREGDSVAVNGVCLTVLSHTKTAWTARLMQETLNKTNLKHLHEKQRVNLELPVKPGEALHGHIVQGHVDGTGEIIKITPHGDDRVFEIKTSAELLKNTISKGSIALEGVSLTVVDVSKSSFTVSLMPYTLTHTTLGEKKVGNLLNIEADKHTATLWRFGIVVEGNKRGATLGFPTANIQLDDATQILDEGVFAVRAMMAGDPTIYAGALHTGPRPTFPNATNTHEIFIINFSKDIYNQKIKFAIIEKIRDIKKFNSEQELISAIQEDVNQITGILLDPKF